MILAGDEDNFNLQGKTALITGAASGIGEATAYKMARAGAKLYLIDNHADRLALVRQHIADEGGDVEAILLDIADGRAIENGFRRIREEAGSLDIVFSNAGIVGLLAPIEEMPEEHWDRLIAVNFKGAFLTIKHAIPLMKDKGGSITVTSSIHGSRTFNSYGYSIYAGTKAGLTAFAKSAALELAKYKIRVNVVSPGSIESRLNDNLHRTEKLREVIIPVEYPEGKYPYGIGTADQVADLVLFLSSSQASYISGADIFIDGVRSLI
ncbi:MAG: 3-ketoacyl-ACP reductase [Cohnella sp.]|nr:3-ketoacyl-ACP reductase [Cohnella sp.]